MKINNKKVDNVKPLDYLSVIIIITDTKTLEIMTTVTRITGQTLNQKVQEEIKNQFPALTGLVKKHVSGVGYVFFLKVNGLTVGKVFKEKGEMVIYNDNK